jgi:hypothetical protein
VSDSIEKTIGDVEYEIIGIENHAKYSLCEAYNIGASKAKFSYLCFMHEDILFWTKNWGNHLINLMLSDKKIGLVGVMGTKFKSTYPKYSWGAGYFLRHMYKGHVILVSGECLNFNTDYKGYNTIQYNTIQYNTIQYNTIQYKKL